MPEQAKPAGSTIIPAMRYRNATTAIRWLCDVFGFRVHLVVPGEGDVIHHAQLCLGSGMLMLGSVADNEFGKFIRQPDEVGGVETQSSYIVVDDADMVYARAKLAGAQIVRPIQDEDYGGRGFTCRDPEGHMWSVGSYDPWREGN
ncbi:MAG TPA: VOC family protein [Burkholderiaceae bacterium]|jgi:uncharacterized glyoxalase superfamily protein PhnB